MNEQEQPRRRRRRLHRTSADWFGLAAMGLLMICSLVLLVQLMWELVHLLSIWYSQKTGLQMVKLL